MNHDQLWVAGRARDAGDGDAEPDGSEKEKDDAGAPGGRPLPIHGPEA